jgi:hypothetical protein
MLPQRLSNRDQEAIIHGGAGHLAALTPVVASDITRALPPVLRIEEPAVGVPEGYRFIAVCTTPDTAHPGVGPLKLLCNSENFRVERGSTALPDFVDRLVREHWSTEARARCTR